MFVAIFDTDMIGFLRLAGIVVCMLVLTAVFMACGEAGCSACVHECCARFDDRAGRTRTAILRIVSSVPGVWWAVDMSLSSVPVAACPALLTAAPPDTGSAPLRV